MGAPPYYTLTPEFDPDDVDAPGWVGNGLSSRIKLQRAIDRLWAQMGIGPGPLGSETTVQQALDDIWAAMNGDIVSITFAPQEIPAIDPLLPDEYFAVTPSSVTGLGSVTTEDTPGYSPVGSVLPEEMQAIGMPPTGDFILPDSPELDPGATALVMIDTDQIHRYGTPSYFYPRLSNMADNAGPTGLDPFIAVFVIRGDPDPYDWDGFTLTMRQIPYNP